jgi:hypothetical protein
MAGTSDRPTLDEFRSACRFHFAFLSDYGFSEQDPPIHRRGNDFEGWFVADHISLIIVGEGYGGTASAGFEHSSGSELSSIDLVPEDHRPRPWKRGMKTLDQIGSIAREAAWVKEHAVDVLSGDLRRYIKLAAPLQWYKRPDESGG